MKLLVEVVVVVVAVLDVDVVEADLIETWQVARVPSTEIMDFLEGTNLLKIEMVVSPPLKGILVFLEVTELLRMEMEESNLKDMDMVGLVVVFVVSAVVVLTMEKLERVNKIGGHMNAAVGLDAG